MTVRFRPRCPGRTHPATAEVLGVVGLASLHAALLADGWSLSYWTWPHRSRGQCLTLRFVWRNRRADSSLVLTRRLSMDILGPVLAGTAADE